MLTESAAADLPGRKVALRWTRCQSACLICGVQADQPAGAMPLCLA